MIRIGQLGVGVWGKKLLRVLGEMASEREGVVLRAVADPSPEARHGLPAGIDVHAQADELLARDDIDAVIVATPPALHHPHAGAALRSGKHVFVEKPLATSAADARDLVELARRADLTLMVGHVCLFTESIRWVKRFLDAGGAGEVRHAFFQRINGGRVRRSVDAMWNLAPHDLAIADFWFGEGPAEVRAFGRSVLEAGRDDASLIRLRYPSGSRACILVSWLTADHARRATIMGSRSTIECDELGPEPIVVHEHATDTPGRSWSPELPQREPLRAELDHFVDCLRSRHEPLANGPHGLRVISTLEAADRSKRERTTVALPL